VDAFVSTYEGISQIRKPNISIYVHQYELFKMHSIESVKEMYIRFTDIIHNLKSLRKVHSNEEILRKFLGSLLWNQWGAKVTTIK